MKFTVSHVIARANQVRHGKHHAARHGTLRQDDSRQLGELLFLGFVDGLYQEGGAAHLFDSSPSAPAISPRPQC